MLGKLWGAGSLNLIIFAIILFFWGNLLCIPDNFQVGEFFGGVKKSQDSYKESFPLKIPAWVIKN